jgi:hypothetical protein
MLIHRHVNSVYFQYTYNRHFFRICASWGILKKKLFWSRYNYFIRALQSCTVSESDKVIDWTHFYNSWPFWMEQRHFPQTRWTLRWEDFFPFLHYKYPWDLLHTFLTDQKSSNNKNFHPLTTFWAIHRFKKMFHNVDFIGIKRRRISHRFQKYKLSRWRNAALKICSKITGHFHEKVEWVKKPEDFLK